MNVEIVNAEGIHFESIPMPKELSGIEWEVMKSTYVRASERWLGKVDGKIACIWGLIPPTFLSDSAYLWLYCNELVAEHKFTFIRHSQRQLEIMLNYYPVIVGHCFADNRSAQKWLVWLGAKWDTPEGKVIPFKIGAENG
jgi:hypothetical protein